MGGNTAESTPLQEELEALRKENTELKKKILELEEDLEKTESQLEVLENMCFALEKEHAFAHEQLQNRSKELGDRTQQLQKTLREVGHQYLQLQQTQAQLIQSEKMAGLGTLVAGVAHEINNPTNFLVLGIHLLQKELKNLSEFLLSLLEGGDADLLNYAKQQVERCFRTLNNIDEGGTRIKTIVKDLRTFSRLDEAECKSINLVDSLESTLHLIQTQYKTSVQFVCDFQCQQELECWPAQLNQVFMNLIVNACQAIQVKQKQTNDETPGLFTLRTFYQDDWFVIQFEDTGCGMTEEVQKRAFEPFFTTKSIGEGTGLGMSISYSIVEKHQGKIEVASEEGQGTTVTLSLPLTIPDDDLPPTV